MTAAYREDLAYIHDVGHGDFARDAAPGLLALLRRQGIREGLVVDLGCGSGIWAEILVREGYRVLGIDLSPARSYYRSFIGASSTCCRCWAASGSSSGRARS